MRPSAPCRVAVLPPLALLAAAASAAAQTHPLADPDARPASAARNLPALAERARPAVLRLRALDSAGATVGEASAVVVAGGAEWPAGRVVTDLYALRGAARAELHDDAGRLVATYTEAVAVSAREDLAVLAPVPAWAAARGLALAPAVPRLGEPVAVLEAADPGGTPTLGHGIVAAVRPVVLGLTGRDTTPALLQLTGVTAGARLPGAPVLDARGAVVGVGRMGIGAPPVPYAATVAGVRALLAAPADARAPFPSAAPPAAVGEAEHKRFRLALYGCERAQSGQVTCLLALTNGDDAGRKARDFFVDQAHLRAADGTRVEAEDVALGEDVRRTRGGRNVALFKVAPQAAGPLRVRFAAVPEARGPWTLSLTVSVGVFGGNETLALPPVPLAEVR